MLIKLNDGTIEDVKTGQARRKIQAGEAVECTEPVKPESKAKNDDDKSKPKSKASGTKANSSADVSGS